MSWAWEVPAAGWSVTADGPGLTLEEMYEALDEVAAVFDPPSPSAA
jgi:hypothetical protein